MRVANGHAELVEAPARLHAALEKAVDMVANEGRQAMLNVVSS